MSATVLWYCALSVFVLCKCCSSNNALVRHFAFFFFFFFFNQFQIVATVLGGTVATVVTVFLSSFFIYIYIYIFFFLLHKKFHNIFTIIEMSFSYKSK